MWQNAGKLLLTVSMEPNNNSGHVRLCYLGLFLVSSSQELHYYNVGLGHLQYTVYLLSLEKLVIDSQASGEVKKTI